MQSVLQFRRIGSAVTRQALPGSPRRSEISVPETLPHAIGEQKGQEKEKEESKTGDSSDEKTNESQEIVTDEFYVHWDGPEDPQNPRNWSNISKAWVMILVWINVFALDWSSSADSQGSTRISEEYGVTKEVEALSSALYVFGIASGALLAGPVSETVGRNPVYVVSRFFQSAFMLGPALAQNIQTQLVCRFLAGLGASSVLAIHGASLADVYGPYGRSLAWPFVALGSFFGTALAPVAGGWIENTESLNWRWMEWIAFIIAGTSFILTALCLPETFEPILLKWKTTHIRRRTGNKSYYSDVHVQDSLLKRLNYAFHRAYLMATKEYIVILLGSWLVVVYIVIFGFLQGFDYLFKDTYGFSDGLKGTVFAAVIVGLVLNTGLAPYFARLYKKQAINWKKQSKSTASFPPEYRLLPAFPVAILFPISMFWLGWTNYSYISPWSGLGAVALFGFCWAGIYVSIYNYILDVYGIYAGSALASITCFRYSAAGMMILVSRPMYEGIGTHWTCTFLGCLATLLLPAPFFFYKYGSYIRARSRFAGQNASGDGLQKVIGSAV